MCEQDSGGIGCSQVEKVREGRGGGGLDVELGRCVNRTVGTWLLSGEGGKAGAGWDIGCSWVRQEGRRLNVELGRCVNGTVRA